MKIQPVVIALGLVAGALTVGSAVAGEDREQEAHGEHEGRGHDREDAGVSGEDGRPGREGGRADTRGAPDPLYVKECGACHVAYPPSFMPGSAWRRVMAGLDRHFGQDAALDDPTRARLERWVLEHAGADRSGGEAPLRISEQGWFRSEHREVPRGAASRPAIRSMASCAACHPGAARWDFEGDRVRIPAG
jgi:hypothetical protein